MAKKVEISDNDLALLAQKGKKAAFEILYVRYFVHIKRKFEVKLSFDSETAKDVAQDFFVKLLGDLSKFNPSKGNFNAWITRGSDNFFIDYIREIKAQKKGSTLSLDKTLSDTEEGISFAHSAQEDFCSGKTKNPEQIAVDNERRNAVLEALKVLDDESREAIKLCYFDGLSYDEICEKTGRGMNSLKGLLFKAKVLLRKSIILE